MGFRDGNAPGQMIQYVPSGQSIESWKELFTERTFPDLQNTSSAGDSFQSYKKTTIENCADAKCTLIENSSVDVMHELAYGRCKQGKPGYEIGRFLSGDRALYQILWQTKATTIDSKVQNRWVDTVGQSAVGPY